MFQKEMQKPPNRVQSMTEEVKQKIISNEFCTLWYHPEGEIIHHRYHKFTFGRVIRELLLKELEYIGQKKSTKRLSDNRNHPAFLHEDQIWIEEAWVPKAVRSGWKYWAIIMPKKTIGKRIMEKAGKELGENHGVTVQVFTDEQQALEWLKPLE